MQAVVKIAGKQFKLAEKTKVSVPLMKQKPGTAVTLKDVLLVEDKGTVTVGNPTVKGASVEATVVGDIRDEKVIVFKKKRRKGYKVRRGHRQGYTELEIKKIVK